MSSHDNPLPYTDTKSTGAADFYFAIHATFRFVLERFGIEGLRRYWSDLGARYYAPVTENWRTGGLAAIAQYWRAFFQAEPGARAVVHELAHETRVEVEVCPLIKHLRDHGREILPCLCQHCYFVSEAMAEPAGFTVRVTGGNGSCVQRFIKRGADPEQQRMEDIAEVTVQEDVEKRLNSES